jgi:O-antigen ligase
LRLALVFTVLAAAALFLGRADSRRRFETVFRLRPFRIFLALVLIAFVGIPLGLYPGNSLKFFTNSYITVVVMLVLTAVSIRSARDVEFLMGAHVIGAVVYVSLALQRFDVGPGGRLSGLVTYDANDVALLVVTATPMAFHFAMRAGSRLWFRLLAILAVVLFVVMIAQSGSRGGFLGFCAVMLYTLFRHRQISVGRRILALTLAGVTLGVVGTASFWDLMGTILNPQEDYNWSGNSASGRMEVWKRGVGYMLAHPATGVGVANFGVAEGQSDLNRRRVQEGKGYRWAAPHSIYVQTGAELGVTGIGLFLLLIAGAIAAMRRIERTPPSARGPPPLAPAVAQALLGSMVGFLVAGAFLSMAYSDMFYALLGMMLGLAKLNQSSGQGPPPVSSRSRHPRNHMRIRGTLTPSMPRGR